MSSDFTSILAEIKTNGTTLDWKESVPGKIFWRVRAMDANGNFSNFSPRGLIIVQLPAPNLKSSYKFVAAARNPNPPILDWDPVPATEKYLVRLGPTRNLAAANERLVGTRTLALTEAPGTYYVKIAAASESGEPLSEFSNAALIKIEPGFFMAQPNPLTPAVGARAPASAGRISVKFSWSTVSKAEMYAVELASDPEFKHIIQKLKTPEATILIKQAQLMGRVYWRVRGESSAGHSEWSVPSYFDVR